MKVLHLPLEGKWFYMTKLGIKKEDYREITPYWVRRFYTMPKDNYLAMELFIEWLKNKSFYKTPEDTMLKQLGITKKTFSINRMTKGYPSKEDANRILNLEHLGIEVRAGKSEWGAQPEVIYFVVVHGDILR